MKIIRDEVLEIIKTKGYDVRPVTKISNGVEFYGIAFEQNYDLSPVYYCSDFPKESDTETLAEMIIHSYLNLSLHPVELKKIMEKDNVLANIYIALQKSGSEKLCKKESGFDGIEQYLIIITKVQGEIYSTKLTPGLVDELDINEDELWQAAAANTFAPDNIIIRPIAQEMQELGCLPDEQCIDSADSGRHPSLYVLTNKYRVNGAGVVLAQKYLKNWAAGLKNADRLALMPSSINEWILAAGRKEQLDISVLNQIVRETNACCVKPSEQLADHCWIADI